MADNQAETTAAFLLRLRASGIRNLDLLRALEAVPRALFLPARLAEYAMRDMALPIACGQTSCRPSFVAQVIDSLGCSGRDSVLEVGAGTGFVTALLGGMSAHVVGLERYRALAEAAEARLRALGVANASVAWADGLADAPGGEPFDRILLHAAVSEQPAVLIDRLAPGGVLVYPLQRQPGAIHCQVLMRVQRGPQGLLSETQVGPSTLPLALTGRSFAL